MCGERDGAGRTLSSQEGRRELVGLVCTCACVCARMFGKYGNRGEQYKTLHSCCWQIAQKQAMKLFFFLMSRLTPEVTEQIQRKSRQNHDQISKSKGVFLANVPSLTSLFLFLFYLAVHRFPPSPEAQCNLRVKQLNDPWPKILK